MHGKCGFCSFTVESSKELWNILLLLSREQGKLFIVRATIVRALHCYLFMCRYMCAYMCGDPTCIPLLWTYGGFPGLTCSLYNSHIHNTVVTACGIHNGDSYIIILRRTHVKGHLVCSSPPSLALCSQTHSFSCAILRGMARSLFPPKCNISNFSSDAI